MPSAHGPTDTDARSGPDHRPGPSRRSDVPPFRVMEVMRAAAAREAAGHPVLHLEVGQPSTPAPSGVIAAAHRALDGDVLAYTGAGGLPQLRDRIARWYDERYGVPVEAERIVVTTGASGSCVLAFLGTFDAGDRVAVLEPGYPCYRNDLLALGVEVVPVPVGPETGFRPPLDALRAAGPLDGVVVASPSNPTGTVLDDDDLAELLAWARTARVTVVADEIYHGISYDRPAPTILAHGDDVVVLNSFSKYFSMTGWRLGWLVAPEPLARRIERLSQSLTIAPPTLSQLAAVAAFDCVDELDANVAAYAANRQLLVDGLAAAGIERWAPPDGAFFLWADVGPLIGHDDCPDGTALCRRWLDEVGVAVTPGLDFDLTRGDRWVRFSYAGSSDDVARAVERLGRWRP